MKRGTAPTSRFLAGWAAFSAALVAGACNVMLASLDSLGTTATWVTFALLLAAWCGGFLAGWRRTSWVMFVAFALCSLAFGFSSGGLHLMTTVPLMLAALLLREWRVGSPWRPFRSHHGPLPRP